MRYTSIRFLLAMAMQYNLQVDQMDVATAFLHGELEVEIFMEQPEKFEDGSKGVCLLHKSIYGLKQASRVWYQKLDTVLQKSGSYVRKSTLAFTTK